MTTPRTAATAAAALAASAAVVVVALPVAEAETTVRLLAERRSVVTTPALAGGQTPAVGSTRVTRWTLKTTDRRPVGYYVEQCAVVEAAAGRDLAHCAGELVFNGSTVTVQGIRRSDGMTNTLAVTGGAGQYRSARGALQDRVVVESDNEMTLTLD